MKVTVETKILNRTLGRIAVATASQISIPILGMVLLRATKDQLSLSTTDLDLFVSENVPSQVQTVGEICISFTLLRNFVARYTSSETTFKLNKNLLEITTGDSVGIFETLPADEFPPPLKIDGQTNRCEADQLVKPLRLVQHAICQDVNRYTLHGVNVHRNRSQTEFVATDGRRLALAKSDMPLESKEDLILPEKAVQAITKLIESGSVEILTSQNAIRVTNGETSITAMLIEGKFPNYQQIIPDSTNVVLSVSRKDLAEAVKTASIFLKRHEIAVRLKSSKKQISVECYDRFRAKLMPAELEDHPAIERSFDHRFLTETLNVLQNDVVRIECAEDQPSAIREADYLEIINPLRDLVG